MKRYFRSKLENVQSSRSCRKILMTGLELPLKRSLEQSPTFPFRWLERANFKATRDSGETVVLFPDILYSEFPMMDLGTALESLLLCWFHAGMNQWDQEITSAKLYGPVVRKSLLQLKMLNGNLATTAMLNSRPRLIRSTFVFQLSVCC